MRVREARSAELPAVATILDAAMLDTENLRDRVRAGDVYVAVAGEARTGEAETGEAENSSNVRILGALVVEPPVEAPKWARNRDTAGHVVAVAVRRRRRDQGIGTALVEAAAASIGSGGPLTAGFDADLRPFYEGLGFEIVATETGRLRGTLREKAPPDR